MPLVYRFATLAPGPGSDTYYLSEPIYIDAGSDMRQLEIDFRSVIPGVEGPFEVSATFNDDKACKKAIERRGREIEREGRRAARVSIYDNQIL